MARDVQFEYCGISTVLARERRGDAESIRVSVIDYHFESSEDRRCIASMAPAANSDEGLKRGWDWWKDINLGVICCWCAEIRKEIRMNPFRDR